MKAISTESSSPSKRSKDWRSRVSRTRRAISSGQNGVAQLPELTATATLHHQSEAAQRFLLESSGEFVSRDSETTLKRLAIQAVPFLADFCFFDVLATDGTIQRVSWAHADTVKHELFELVHEFVPARSSIDDPVSKVLRTGQPEFVPEVNDAWMWAVATSQRHFELMRELQLRSMIAVPLQVPGGTLGCSLSATPGARDAVTAGKTYGWPRTSLTGRLGRGECPTLPRAPSGLPPQG